jgi:hypothetical protein
MRIMVLAIVGFVVPVPPPAHAMQYDFDWAFTGTYPGFAGSGNTWGTIRYFPTDNTLAKYLGQIRDECPADGKGVIARLTANYTNGPGTWILSDTNGCGATWEYKLSWTTFPFAVPLTQMRVDLWNTEGRDPFGYMSSSGWKVRP